MRPASLFLLMYLFFMVLSIKYINSFWLYYFISLILGVLTIYFWPQDENTNI